MILSTYRKLRRELKKTALYLHRRNILKQVQGGKNLHLEGRIMVIRPDKLTLGRNVHIGAGAYINCNGGVAIGDHSILSRGVVIYSYDHNFKTPRCLPFDDTMIAKPVKIGRYVWIGMNVAIVPGTTIGAGAVIGIGSVVSGDVPENAIVVSPKQRVTGFRDAEQVKRLAAAEQFYETYWH